MTNKEIIIKRLREVADFLEHQCVGEMFDNRCYGGASVWFRFEDKEMLKGAIVGKGTLAKEANGDTFSLRKRFRETGCYVGDSLVDFDIKRDLICEKRVTTKVIPAREQMVIPAEPERTIEEVSWDCPDSILRPDAPALVAEAEPLPSYACDGSAHIVEENGQLIVKEGAKP